MPELNEPQARAVAHASGPLLVFAGAGSGKTRVITYRVANLLAEHRVPPYRILAVTFTNKAAGELKGRLAALAGEGVVRDLWVGTFHSVCARLLRRYHDEVGLDGKFVIYDDADQKAVMQRVLKGLGVDDRTLAPKSALAMIHREKREGRGPRDVDLGQGDQGALLVEVYEGYQKAMATANAVDFEDLIVHVMRLAEDAKSPGGEELRRRFEHVLVDEFQDTNLTQYRLIRALAAREQNLCVVGDDDQSIYRWRGADVRLIRGFRRDFPDATVVKLEQNYRSTGHIVSAALAVIEPASEREPKELWTAAPSGEKVRVRAVTDERDEASFVARSIQAELGRGTPASEIAVFYRIHAQSRVLEEGLRAANLPYQIVGGTKFFERAEVKDLVSYLRLIDNPRSDADLMRIVNVPARGIGQKTISRLLDLAAARGTSGYDAVDAALEDGELGSAGKKRLDAFRGLMEELRGAAETLGPHELAGKVLESTGYRQALRDADTAEADARLENLEEFLGSIGEYEEELTHSGEQPTLAGYLERIALVSAVDSMKDAPKVSLMTVHSAKGLEFTSVIVTGMEEEMFPYYGMNGEEPDELDEERRLAYVAITRARARLILIHAGTRTIFGRTRYQAPSRFLDDLPESAVSREGGARAPSLAPAPAWRASMGAGPARPAARFRSYGAAPAPGTRVVDRDAFDDLPPGEPGVVLRAGDRVQHQRFGEGVVESVEGGASPTVVARFPGFGTRRIKAEYLAPRAE
ncbi:MAG: UvrD-helicase domain-containing protein [Sorangiineae bacterium]|nr:UvrD-helicase domain-containing protein [Polyangiaceae bacterium]MEB2321859.1 UvrD-helicase domain-containing protein [Sorangiineae bacterium]